MGLFFAPANMLWLVLLALAVALSAELGSQVRRPEAPLLYSGLQRRYQLLSHRVARIENILDHVAQRLDLFTNEGLDPVEVGLVIRIGLETPHISPLSSAVVPVDNTGSR